MVESNWVDFLDSATLVLAQVASGRFDMESAMKFFEESPAICGELEEFFVNSISEADAEPIEFFELTNFLKTRPSKAQLVDYMNSPA